MRSWQLIIALILATTTIQAHYTIESYTDGTNSANLTYSTGTEWYTKQLSIPKGAAINNAYMYLSGFNYTKSYMLGRFNTDLTFWTNESASSRVNMIECSSLSLNNCPTGVTKLIAENSDNANYVNYSLNNTYGGVQNISVTLRFSGVNAGYLSFTSYTSTTFLQFQKSSAGCDLNYQKWIINSANISWGNLNTDCVAHQFDKITAEFHFADGYARVYLNDVYKLTAGITGSTTVKYIRTSAASGSQYWYFSNHTINGTGGEQYDVLTWPTNATVIINNATNAFNYGSANGSNLNHLVLANLTTSLNLPTSTPQNISFRSNTSGVLEYSGLHVEYTFPINLTFSNKTDAEIVASNGSWYVYGATTLNWTSESFPKNEKIAILFNNITNIVSTEKGWYQHYEFYNNLTEAINDTLLVIVPNQAQRVKMQGEGGSTLDGYITVYKSEGGPWRIVSRQHTTGNPSEATFFLIRDATYLFKGEADDYNDGNTTFFVQQSSSPPLVEIEMSKTSPYNQYSIMTNCTGTITTLTADCTLFITTDVATPIDFIIHQNLNNTWANYTESTTSITSGTYEKEMNYSATWPTYQIWIYLNDIYKGTVRFNYQSGEVIGTDSYQGYIVSPEGYNYTTANITILTKYKDKYRGYFLLGIMFSFIIVASLMEHYKKGWGIPAGIISTNLYGFIYPWIFAINIPIILWILWRYVFKKIAVDKV